eukprot:gene3172-13186_t
MFPAIDKSSLRISLSWIPLFGAAASDAGLENTSFCVSIVCEAGVIKADVVWAEPCLDICAVSYRWPQEEHQTLDLVVKQEGGTPGEALETDPYTFTLSENLVASIQRLLEFYKLVWVDHICIVQDSIVDKSREVGKMGFMYSAVTTLVLDGFLQLNAPPKTYWNRAWTQQEQMYGVVKLPFIDDLSDSEAIQIAGQLWGQFKTDIDYIVGYINGGDWKSEEYLGRWTARMTNMGHADSAAVITSLMREGQVAQASRFLLALRSHLNILSEPDGNRLNRLVLDVDVHPSWVRDKFYGVWGVGAAMLGVTLDYLDPEGSHRQLCEKCIFAGVVHVGQSPKLPASSFCPGDALMVLLEHKEGREATCEIMPLGSFMGLDVHVTRNGDHTGYGMGVTEPGCDLTHNCIVLTPFAAFHKFSQYSINDCLTKMLNQRSGKALSLEDGVRVTELGALWGEKGSAEPALSMARAGGIPRLLERVW